MLEPYANRAGVRGEAAWPWDEFQTMVRALDGSGIQIYTHAIGDKAVRITLDAYQSARRKNSSADWRHRVEHIETVSPDDLPRFTQQGVIASMQPIHADPSGVEMWSAAVGEKRLTWAFPWRSIEQARGRLVFSSDWPASISANPIRGIHNAVNRRTINGKPEGGWTPWQRVSVETALRGYTSSAAYASFEEGLKGQIKPFLVADLVVWSQDLFRVDPMRIHETRPVWTIFDGRIIYENR
jgi:predicted amidohydrolase YtcJ